MLSSWQDELVDLSSLTRIQYNTLKSFILIKEGKINLQIALKNHKKLGIRPGTYYRILKQARTNVLQSVYTLLLAAQVGLLRPEDVQRLLSTVAAIPPGLDEEKRSATVEIIRTLVTRIVMSQ